MKDIELCTATKARGDSNHPLDVGVSILCKFRVFFDTSMIIFNDAILENNRCFRMLRMSSEQLESY